jgi:PHP family Zn ribbon phosphoesterase
VLTKGVFERINEIADYLEPHHPVHRSQYFYQIPLEYIPGLGKKVMAKLLEAFDTEMNILHYATYEALSNVAGNKIAGFIMNARSGNATISAGGGGVYGRMMRT